MTKESQQRQIDTIVEEPKIIIQPDPLLDVLNSNMENNFHSVKETDKKIVEMQQAQNKVLQELTKDLKQVNVDQQEQSKKITDVQQDLQIVQEQQELKNEVLIGDDQWTKLVKSGQDAEIYLGAWLNIFLGIILGYIAARGFFASWR